MYCSSLSSDLINLFDLAWKTDRTEETIINQLHLLVALIFYIQ